MKHLTISVLATLAVLLAPASVLAQESLKARIARIERDFGVSFVYASSLPLESRQAAGSGDGRDLAGVLKESFEGTGISYEVRRKNVILKPAAVKAVRKHTVCGHITDAADGETLIGAAVVSYGNGGSPVGTVTNNYGFYSITLPEGDISLEYNYLGYESTRQELRLTKDTVINIAFKPARESLSGAKVTASRSETGVLGTQMSAVEIPVNMMKNIPAIGGEVDVIKAVQLLPGVQSGTEGSAGLYVRGGGPDENLLLLDGVPVYNVNHMLGFFSVFDADAIKNVTLYKGSFPARFGSRLSSVLDVRMKDGNDQEYHGSVSVGLLSAKFNAEGPIIKGKTTFCVSARRTYYDVLAAPLVWMITKNEFGNIGNIGYNFYDVNAKVTHRAGNRDKLYFSFYHGRDNLYADIKESGERTFENSVTTSSSNDMNLGWGWGNTIAAARWNHVFSPKVFMNVTGNYSGYSQSLGLSTSQSSSTMINDADNPSFSAVSEDMALGYNSIINDISVLADFEYAPSVRHDVKCGISATRHTFHPAVTTMMVNESSQDGQDKVSSSIDTTYGDRNLLSSEFALYGEDNWSVTDRIKVNAGLRASLYAVDGKTFGSLEPRVSMRFLASDDLSFKAAYSEMNQYVHLLSNSVVSMPNDLWVPVTSSVPPMRSHQAVAGASYSWHSFDFSIEGYYKTMDNVLEYRDGATFFNSTSGWEEKVACGRGWSYGVELLAQRKAGNTTGWIGYTWSRSMRQFDRPGNVINGGEPFPAKYDRRHDLSVVVNHKFNAKVDLSGTFVYGTGNCGTLATQQIFIPKYDDKHIPVNFYSYNPVSCAGWRNNFRMPAYHRLDLGVNFHKRKKTCERIFNLSLYNAYNHLNPLLVYPKNQFEYDDCGELHGRTSLVKLAIFPIMPSFSLTYKF